MRADLETPDGMGLRAQLQKPTDFLADRILLLEELEEFPGDSVSWWNWVARPITCIC